MTKLTQVQRVFKLLIFQIDHGLRDIRSAFSGERDVIERST